MMKIRFGVVEWITDAIRGDEDAREVVAFHVGMVASPILLLVICACF